MTGRPSVDSVVRMVASEFGIEVAIMLNTNNRRAAPARAVAAYILRHACGLSYPEIAAALNATSHSNVMQAVARARPNSVERVMQRLEAIERERHRPKSTTRLREVFREMIAAFGRQGVQRAVAYYIAKDAKERAGA